MDRFLKVLLLVMWGAFAVALSQDLGGSQIGAGGLRKPGDCPKVSEGSEDYTQCSETCVDKDNCTTNTCDSDPECEGSFKCCRTICGTACVPPVFRNPCQDNFDCPWSLKCCEGVCDSDCVYQSKNKDPTQNQKKKQ
ncbi:uncharacterized protein LOC143930802 isoform X1 [Lithobates pipiens]